MYYTQYNKRLRLFLVINVDTKLAHSSWDNSLDARCTARDLNHQVRVSIKTHLNRLAAVVECN